MSRGYRNRDYIETVEGLLFTVVGDIHPPDRVLAYLKYIPDSEGKWGTGTRRYDRALRYYSTLHLKETLNYLEQKYPQYLYNSKVQRIMISAVPLDSIRKHYCPEIRLSDLIATDSLDKVETKAVELSQLISRCSGVGISAFGVTGSVLVGIHNPKFSDVDLTVYGKENSLNVKATLTTMEKESGKIRRFNEREINRWLKSASTLYPLERYEVEIVYRRHWNRGMFNGIAFSIHPGRVETEVEEKHGDRLYSTEGIVEAWAVVESADDSMFMPGEYHVNSVGITKGHRVPDVREIVTYEGFYCDIASPGEKVKIRGKLERIKNERTGEIYHRILIGSLEAKGSDYLKPDLKRGPEHS